MNKKIIAVKQIEVLRDEIDRRLSGMSSAQLEEALDSIKAIEAKGEIGIILGRIGRVYEVPFSDGRKTTAVMLTLEGIRSLGIDLYAAFRGCGGKEVFNEETVVKNGILVNLDLYQQVALLRAIVGKKPELASILGFYNLRASRKVYEVLNRGNAHKELGIYWMWTGDKWVRGQEEMSYPEEVIVPLEDLGHLEGYCFCYRSFYSDYWSGVNPDGRRHIGAVVLGAQF